MGSKQKLHAGHVRLLMVTFTMVILTIALFTGHVDGSAVTALVGTVIGYYFRDKQDGTPVSALGVNTDDGQEKETQILQERDLHSNK